jgi:hypothetical protein
MPGFEHHVFICGNVREPGHRRGCCDPDGNGQLRAAFKQDEEGYMAKFGLTQSERDLVRKRDFAGMIRAGMNIYWMLKIGAVTGNSLYRMGAQMRGERLDAVDGGGGGEQPRGVELQGLHLIGAQMLVQPCAPGEFHAVSRLEHRLHALRPAAAHHAQVPAVHGRHRLDNDAGLAMPAGAEHNAFVAPFHAPVVAPLSREFKPARCR